MIWLKAIRPRTLVAGISPVIMGTAMAFSHGFFNGWILLFTLLTALGIQITSNLVNDYADFLKGADNINRQGPLRATAAGLISVTGMKRAAFVSTLFTVFCGSVLIWKGGVLIALLIAFSIVLAYAYTAGPFPLAYLGLGDLFVFLFFGPAAVGGAYYLQTGQLPVDVLIAGLCPGALSTAILVMNNLRDKEEDQQAGKKTLIVRFGRVFGKCEYLFCQLLASLLPLYFLPQKPFIFLASLIIIPALFIWVSLFKTQNFAPLFPKTAQLVMLFTILFSMGWML